MARAASLKSMSIDKLSKLKDQVDAAIASRVVEERRTLQGQLGKLSRFEHGGARAGRVRSRGAIPPPRQSHRDVGRSRVKAALACGGSQVRQEIGAFRHRARQSGKHEKDAEAHPQSREEIDLAFVRRREASWRTTGSQNWRAGTASPSAANAGPR